jgi:Mg2+ and Co2+ transporter CorA
VADSIDKATKALQSSIETIDQQINTANDAAQNQQKVLNDEVQSVTTLSRKLADAERVSNAADVGVGAAKVQAPRSTSGGLTRCRSAS